MLIIFNNQEFQLFGMDLCCRDVLFFPNCVDYPILIVSIYTCDGGLLVFMAGRIASIVISGNFAELLFRIPFLHVGASRLLFPDLHFSF